MKRKSTFRTRSRIFVMMALMIMFSPTNLNDFGHINLTQGTVAMPGIQAYSASFSYYP